MWKTINPKPSGLRFSGWGERFAAPAPCPPTAGRESPPFGSVERWWRGALAWSVKRVKGTVPGTPFPETSTLSPQPLSQERYQPNQKVDIRDMQLEDSPPVWRTISHRNNRRLGIEPLKPGPRTLNPMQPCRRCINRTERWTAKGTVPGTPFPQPSAPKPSGRNGINRTRKWTFATCNGRIRSECCGFFSPRSTRPRRTPLPSNRRFCGFRVQGSGCMVDV